MLSPICKDFRRQCRVEIRAAFAPVDRGTLNAHLAVQPVAGRLLSKDLEGKAAISKDGTDLTTSSVVVRMHGLCEGYRVGDQCHG